MRKFIFLKRNKNFLLNPNTMTLLEKYFEKIYEKQNRDRKLRNIIARKNYQ